jgi:hypothetical protein
MQPAETSAIPVLPETVVLVVLETVVTVLAETSVILAPPPPHKVAKVVLVEPELQTAVPILLLVRTLVLPPVLMPKTVATLLREVLVLAIAL